jgi:hypothetical protein
MDQEWNLSNPMTGRYSLGPSRRYCIDIASKYVTRSRECLITKWVKRLVGNKIELGMVDTKWSDLRQVIILRDKRNCLCSLSVRTITVHCRVSGSHHGFPNPVDDYWPERSLDHVHVIHRRVTHLRFVVIFEWIQYSDRITGHHEGCFRKALKLFWHIEITQGGIC